MLRRPVETGPITDVKAVISAQRGACCPAGYRRVEAANATGVALAAKPWDGDLNAEAGGAFVYLCYTRRALQPAQPPISELVAFVTPSAADPYEPCPAGYTKLGNATTGDLNSGSKNPGVAYLCAKRAAASGGTRLVAVVGNASEPAPCPSGKFVQGTPAQPGPFQFDPAGVGVRLCFG